VDSFQAFFLPENELILEEAECSVTSLADSVVIIELRHQWKVGKKSTPELNSDIVNEYLGKIYEVFNDMEEKIMVGTPFSENRSKWQSPFINFLFKKKNILH